MKTITEALKDHHDEMRDLMKKIDKDPENFILLKKNLDVHHELEEDLLLSELNTMDDVKKESLESQEEHYVLNVLLLDLADFPKDNYRWKVKMGVLEEILNHHLDEEEEDLFPEAEEKLSKTKLEKLGKKFLDLKKKRLEMALETKDL
ncbi:hemerythrin domain-containing protein [Mangrovibacterium diazotrophicum]|uniref:Hemerythrin HHE cation binding domain-containing protein n=1 Tax=Mangrovibacterium diazotrophicum TaxID=1261403 RepID=A0A419W6L3_9BACT|nr:hemerythrin domain-containing protein [Mangrovibacterium diazotrophicum]RKD91104.1 hemerythrin HHE cation binding domain-containing protein [Mangrovibacterium diazotrophicum]